MIENTKIEEKKEIITRKHWVRKVKCDLCGKDIANYKNYNDFEDEIYFENNEFELDDEKPILGVQTKSYNYGDCAGAYAEIYDVCYKCYCEKVKPLLKEKLDIVPREVEWSR